MHAGNAVRLSHRRVTLFLDEVNERPYRLDRMVTQLRQAVPRGQWRLSSGTAVGAMSQPALQRPARCRGAFNDFPGALVGFIRPPAGPDDAAAGVAPGWVVPVHGFSVEEAAVE